MPCVRMCMPYVHTCQHVVLYMRMHVDTHNAHVHVVHVQGTCTICGMPCMYPHPRTRTTMRTLYDAWARCREKRGSRKAAGVRAVREQACP